MAALVADPGLVDLLGRARPWHRQPGPRCPAGGRRDGHDHGGAAEHRHRPDHRGDAAAPVGPRPGVPRPAAGDDDGTVGGAGEPARSRREPAARRRAGPAALPAVRAGPRAARALPAGAGQAAGQHRQLRRASSPTRPSSCPGWRPRCCGWSRPGGAAGTAGRIRFEREQDHLVALRSGVRVQPGSFTFGSRSGRIPLTLVNDLPQSVVVVLRLEPQTPRLRLDPPLAPQTDRAEPEGPGRGAGDRGGRRPGGRGGDPAHHERRALQPAGAAAHQRHPDRCGGAGDHRRRSRRAVRGRRPAGRPPGPDRPPGRTRRPRWTITVPRTPTTPASPTPATSPRT